jgi:hypothetical protein
MEDIHVVVASSGQDLEQDGDNLGLCRVLRVRDVVGPSRDGISFRILYFIF